MYRINIAILIILLSITSSTAYTQGISMGIAAKASTSGIGGDAALRLNERMVVRAGFDQFKYNRGFEFREADIDYDANVFVRTGALSGLFDYYLAPNFFATGGFGVNRFNVITSGKAISDLKYGDISIPADKIGNFNFDVKPTMKISPYIGIGFGQTLNQNSRVGFAFELGTYYQGAPEITIETDGLLAPTSNPDHGQKELLEQQLSQYYLYPIMRLNLSVRIIEL
jgi:hypothetical protein